MVLLRDVLQVNADTRGVRDHLDLDPAAVGRIESVVADGAVLLARAAALLKPFGTEGVREVPFQRPADQFRWCQAHHARSGGVGVRKLPVQVKREERIVDGVQHGSQRRRNEDVLRVGHRRRT